MIEILAKDTIEKYIIPFLSKAKRGYVSKVFLWEIVNAILYKFKTGVQWSLLPIKSLIMSDSIKAGAVYHHFNKWSKDGSWKRAWQNLLKNHKSKLDLSITNLDGTHSPSKRGGQEVDYQRRKKCRTTNTLWITDAKGNVVAFAPAVAGNHHDVYHIKEQFNALLQMLKDSDIAIEGLFLNADAGFDCQELRDISEQKGICLNVPENKRNRKKDRDLDYCLDELMYENRYVVERANAWMDSNRSFIIRYDTSLKSWMAWHFIFCIKHWINNVLKV